MTCPRARLPGTGMDYANLTCIITIANTNDLATTSLPPLRAFVFHTTQYVRVVPRGREA